MVRGSQMVREQLEQTCINSMLLETRATGHPLIGMQRSSLTMSAVPDSID